jgi:hypothetical protein
MNILAHVILITLALACPATVNAEIESDSEHPWSYIHSDHEAAASDVFLPIGSFVLPGLGQWVRGQNAYGSLYTGIAIAGSSYASVATGDLDKSQTKNPELGDKNIALRKFMLGLQTSQSMGGFSLYHTFRSSVWQRKPYGQYSFLGQGETPLDLVKAPLAFENLTRPSTFIPLGVALGIGLYNANHPITGYHKEKLSGADLAFAGGFSFNAGTHEEAVFRGWLMPLLHESGLSPFMANLSQASAFALAHIGSNPVPLPQLIIGFHLGRVSQARSWTLQESIFIHTWWDVIAFTANYYIVKNESGANSANNQNSQRYKPLTLLLPPLQLSF